MHYYKRHLGDYARDTGHLTALEHGIYTLLLDWYYINECPIPVDKAKRIARGNPEETQTVLTEFFVLSDAGWHHSRADREIAEYHEKAERNRESGKLGGRPPKNPTETQTVPKANPDITLTTNHNKDQKKKPARKRASSGVDFKTFIADCKAKGEKPIPDDDPIFAYAEKVGLPRDHLALAWAWFKDKRGAEGQTQSNWRAHFRDAVKGNWPKYWYATPDGGWGLTTAGQQAARAQA